VIYLANGQLAPEVVSTLVHAGLASGIFISPVSAWEVGLLSRPKRGNSVQFLPNPETWFARVLAAPAIREAPLTADIAIDSAHLPGTFHGDPADRLLVATARHMDVPILTRDTRIQAYAASGFCRVVAC
jgi:PIN domain nuclease of toxin-antitoxin system